MVASHLKRMGVLAGMPDLLLYWRGGAGVIEMKSKGGGLSANQREILERFQRMGHRTAVCRTPKEAEAAVREWGLDPAFPAPLVIDEMVRVG